MIVLVAAILDSGKKLQSREVVFDVIEINHRHDENWRHCYDQVILWDWSPDYRRHNVMAWFLIENQNDLNLRQVGDSWRIRTYSDLDIRSKVKIETWTNYDPERKSKELFDDKYRRGLK